MKQFLAAASAAVIALALAGPVAAQDLGLKQLQDSATSSMAKLGMDTSMVEVLTLEELSQVQSITNSGGSEQSQKDRLDTVLRAAEERVASGGAVVPNGAGGDVNAADLGGVEDIRHSVRTEIAKLGMNSEIDVDQLSNDQLLRIQLITQGAASESEKKTQIELITEEN